MKVFIKIALTISMVVLIAHAQTPTSSTQNDSTSKNIQQPPAVVYPAGEKKTVAKVLPKTPTNWSKVKELFL